MPVSKPKKSTASSPAKKSPAATKSAAAASKSKSTAKASPKAAGKSSTATKASKPAASGKSAASKAAGHTASAKKVSGNGSAPAAQKPTAKLSPVFLEKQKQRLLRLKDELLDSMNGVAKDTLRARAEGSEGSAFGMHQADAGSDAYDRDFALSLLSVEQNSLYEIDQALERINEGTYGICEISGKPIPHPRLEALPFTRYTVECQAELEKQNRHRARVPVNSLFGLNDGDGDEEEEDSTNDQKD